MKKQLVLTHDQKMFIKDFVKAIKNDNAAIFAGAGLSIPSGTMSWPDLLKDVAEELKLSNDTTTDMATMAQYYENLKGSRAEISEIITSSFEEYIVPNINQELIAQLPIKTIWTTNYDDLLEQAYKKEYKKVLVKRSPTDFSLKGKNSDLIIYKMHGDVQQPTKAIITKNDYETYNDTHSVYTTALKGDLVEKKFLFIGFSFDDPNLNYVLARIRALVGEHKPNHYFFIEKIKQANNESEADFDLRKTKQNLKIKDLKRYGINAVLLESYAEITQILEVIKRMVNLNNIFISGAKVTDREMESLADQLIETVSGKLVTEGNMLTSGFGVGVGSRVIDAVIETVSNNPWDKLDEHLKVYPFPQIKDTNWTLYRKEMLENVGISIFFFGTKIEKKNA
ncbi:SIR2 family protein [Enterococcus faecalis]